MPIHYSKKVISSTDVEKIVALSENWIMDMKGKDIKPAKLSRTVSAFANSNGGEIYLETIVLDYLKEHETINNAIARSLTGITDSNKMKKIFYVLKDKELLEIVPGTRGVATRWRMKSKPDYDAQRPGDQLTLF